jgi:hypothetical protein
MTQHATVRPNMHVVLLLYKGTVRPFTPVRAFVAALFVCKHKCWAIVATWPKKVNKPSYETFLALLLPAKPVSPFFLPQPLLCRSSKLISQLLPMLLAAPHQPMPPSLFPSLARYPALSLVHAVLLFHVTSSE